jgi:cell division protein FtsQ
VSKRSRPLSADLALLVIALAGLVACWGALRWTSRLPRFDLRAVEVHGAADDGAPAPLRHVNRAQVRTALSGGRLDGGWFSIHLADARTAFESIPWVGSVSVRRVWPNRLVATLHERRSIGLWDDGRMLAEDGTLFAGNPAEAELDGPQLQFSGPARFAPQACAGLARWSQALAAMGMTLARIDVSERGSWTLRSAAGQAIELGRDEPEGSIDRRLAAIQQQFPTVLARIGGTPTRVDARYGNGFTVSGP